MSLLQRYLAFIKQEQLFTANDKLLLAVSGGIDSAVLCALCHQAGYDFAIAHCNFRLRGAESDRDEAFVRSLGERYDREVLVQSFDTEAYALQHKVSIQVAARELRYAWFASLMRDENNVSKTDAPTMPDLPGIAAAVVPRFDYLLTAHHLDDNVETLLMKFFKGTGIAGLQGILPKQGTIVRPLLFARKEELVSFAETAQLQWVEDSSNAQDKYARNFLRLQVLPLLQQLYPEVVGNLAGNIDRFRDVALLYHQSLQQHLKQLLEQKGEEVHIPVLKLKQHEPLTTLVYEIAKPYGFTAAQTAAIIHLLDSETGRYVASATHRIIRNRNWLIIAPAISDAAQHVLVEATDQSIAFPGGQLQLQPMSVKEVPVPIVDAPVVKEEAATAGKKKKTVPRQAANPYDPVAYIDRKSLEFPLLLRPWKAGDYFYPLGMQKKKKLARFFIDQKLSATDKEKVWVLESNKRIVWVIGMRIDNRFRVVAATRQVMQVTFSSGNP
ncbi:tRNA lysidine(34) synthetase TilS [Paraflavitalea pollutisoli]|uniref:tRNA lysidine(34) synthetase TilS n=1 Tax=Paraflavitalea pollutisoli TaxID=3034143 RepID=UPI0023EE14BF|nr:tRNA lysidine(34) synthetase TilS [Paraflavitalea sp. H1-2-19X]